VNHDSLCPGTLTKVRVTRTISSSGLTPDVVEEARTFPCECDLIAKVRADEREKAIARHTIQRERLRVVMRADLRANVEALHVLVTTNDLLGTTRYVRLGDVLALIDGSGDAAQ